ncbi:MAG: cytochrome C oxidase subunit IV family protein [Dehalococcoidia bacterium]
MTQAHDAMSSTHEVVTHGHHAGGNGHSNGKSLLRAGFVVVVLLAILTVTEFYVAKHVESNLAPIFAIAIVKTALILWYFMHVARSWASKGAH